ncbi:MAG TPA: TIM-barrel domain-containing protein [Terriglobales bacterium]|jgi:alpha-glucosidase|nr:TIM-barrel domain-containing protein [Terriglobales bacterium]
MMGWRCERFLVFFSGVVLFGAGIASGSGQAQTAAASQAVTLDAVTNSQTRRDGIDIQAGPASLRITALRDDILRVRVAPGGTFPEDASWAVLPGPRSQSVDVQPVQDAASVGFRTSALDVRVERDPLRIVVRDLAGNVISADAIGRPTQFQLGGFSVHKSMPGDEHYFGLGDKAGTFDRRNQAYTLWNTDIGTQESIDPIYKSIPFFLGIGGGRSYGLFLDNTWRSWFDFGKQSRDAYSFSAEGGPLDYYLIYGPSPKQVVEGYAYLTGTHPLPPLWSLGFQQSRYSYYPESQIREIAGRFRHDKIPGDVLYLDIDYQYRNRPFTVDPRAFPNFPGLVSDLRKQHFHLVLITDLHIAHAPNQGYSPYDTGEAGNQFVKKADGSEYVGVVWPGPAVFPDFTRAQTRVWWGGLYKEFVQNGVAGFWNDMNEPAVFDGPGKTMPLDNVHRIEEPGFTTRTATHSEIHNIVGLENARATYDGLLKLRPDERPFVLTRATFAGGQRYGFTWTGDNSSTWNHLRLATQQLLNLGISGISFVGDDIGGFNGSPAPDLLTRWIEVGAFNPMFRDHTTKGSLMQEVWVHGPEQEAIRRRYIETRYRLLPYIYTLAEESSRTGLPMVRPIFLEFPEVFTPPSNGFGNLDSEFLLGPSLLVAPQPFAETMDNYVVSFPNGPWYDFWTGLKTAIPPPEPSIVQVSTDINKNGPGTQYPFRPFIHPTLDTLPVYVRGGSILPLQPLVQSTDETPNGPLELRVYPGPQCNGSLYLDDGHTFRYQHGEFLRQAFTCQSDGNSLRVSFAARQGTYAPWWKTVEVVIYDWPSAQANATLSGSASALKTSYDAAQHALHVTIPDVAGAAELRVGD